MAELPAKVNPISSAYVEYLNKLVRQYQRQQRTIEELKLLCNLTPLEKGNPNGSGIR